MTLFTDNLTARHFSNPASTPAVMAYFKPLNHLFEQRVHAVQELETVYRLIHALETRTSTEAEAAVSPQWFTLMDRATFVAERVTCVEEEIERFHRNYEASLIEAVRQQERASVPQVMF